jgi:hypothetical protein
MHIPSTTIALLAIIPFTFAAPKPPCRPVKTSYTAQYDDLPYVEPGPNPIPPHYYGLSYTTFQVDRYDFWIPPTSGNQWTMAFGGSGNISVPDQYVHLHPPLPLILVAKIPSAHVYASSFLNLHT